MYKTQQLKPKQIVLILGLPASEHLLETFWTKYIWSYSKTLSL